MKNSVWIVVIGLLMSCGSRTSNVEKINNKASVEVEQKTIENKIEVSDIQQTKDKKEYLETQKVEEKSENMAMVQSKQKQSESKSEELGKKSQKDKVYHRTYYPNGQLKSEKEITKEKYEAYSKLKDKNEYLQASVITLAEMRDLLTEENKVLKKSKDSLIQVNKKQMEINRELHKVLTNQQTIMDKQTDRKDSWWLYVVIGLSSIIGWEVLKRLFLKLKSYVVYFR